MNKTKPRVILVTIALILIVVLYVLKLLNSEYNCYEHKYDDGFTVRTGFEVIDDYRNDIRYEEIIKER